MTEKFHLAQINIGKVLYPVDDPRMAGFMDNLDKINTLAEATEGFVWRLKTDEGNATSIHAFDDPMLLLNISVWKDIDSLYRYAYKSEHGEFFARRREWFSKIDLPTPVLWWIDAGQIPSPEEAKERINYVAANGASPYAFTFKERYSSVEWERHLNQNLG
jgi:hypothetical protein